MPRIGIIPTSLALAVAMLFSTGCRGPWSKDWKLRDMAPWGDNEDEPQVPRRLVSTWVDTVLHQGGKKPQRGFGGRIIFYGKESNEKPVLVDGQVVIYAFDETNREPTDNKPSRRYVFPADQVARRMSKSELGPSYSFWLPWDDVGGAQTEISLIARFEPKEGPIVIGEQTKHLLPGETSSTGITNSLASTLPEGIPARPVQPTLATVAAAAGGTGQVQLASYEAPVATPAPLAQATLEGFQLEGQPIEPQQQRRMTTTSISLPENFRVQGGGAIAIPTNHTLANTLPQAPGTVPAGNVLAQPQAGPPTLSAVAAPIGYPAVNMAQGTPQTAQPFQQMPAAYPGFVTPQPSPLGSGFVAPLGPANAISPQPTPANVGRVALPPRAPLMTGQQPLTTAAGWATVNYPQAPAVQPGTVQPVLATQPSSGFPPR